MPDNDISPNPAPADWGTAFAALPMEAPPADGWKRMAHGLDTRADTAATHSRRTRWPTWLAAAAVVSAIALVPVLMRDTGAPTVPENSVATAPSPATTATPAQAAASAEPQPAPSTVAATTIPTPTLDTTTARQPASTPRKRRPSPMAPPHAVEPRRMVASAETSPTPATATADDTDAATGNALAMQSLQAESAQLEALVAMARDDRVASANGAALTAGLDERIGRIDASLSQPGLADVDRTLLWQERVATMRELAGIETTQRWLTANGERYDGALVSID